MVTLKVSVNDNCVNMFSGIVPSTYISHFCAYIGQSQRQESFTAFSAIPTLPLRNFVRHSLHIAYAINLIHSQTFAALCDSAVSLDYTI